MMGTGEIINIIAIIINSIWAYYNYRMHRTDKIKEVRPLLNMTIELPPDDLIGDTTNTYIIKNEGKDDAYKFKVRNFYQDDECLGRINGFIDMNDDKKTIRKNEELAFKIYWEEQDCSVKNDNPIEDSILRRTAEKKEYFQFEFTDKHDTTYNQTVQVNYVNKKQKTVVIRVYDPVISQQP